MSWRDAGPARPSACPPGGRTRSASAAQRPRARRGAQAGLGGQRRGPGPARGELQPRCLNLRLGPRPPPRARAVPARNGPGGGAHPVLRLQLRQPLLPQRLQLLLRHGAAVLSRAAAAKLRGLSSGARARGRPSPLRRRPQRPGITNPARSRAASRSQGAGRGPIARSQAVGCPAAFGHNPTQIFANPTSPPTLDALLTAGCDRTARGKG